MSNVAQTVGANVRRLRRNRGLSLVDLGQRAGVAKGTLTQLEAGRGNPTLDTIQSLGRALGVTVPDLVSEQADDAPIVVRSDAAAPLPDSPLDARLVHRSHAGGSVVELYRLRLDARQRVESPGHPQGVVEQLFVLSGTLGVGPADATVTAGPHDFVRFPADRPHRYEAADGPVGALLWMTFPSRALDAPPRTTRPAGPTVTTTATARRSAAGPRAPQAPARGTRPAGRRPQASAAARRAPTAPRPATDPPRPATGDDVADRDRRGRV